MNGSLRKLRPVRSAQNTKLRHKEALLDPQGGLLTSLTNVSQCFGFHEVTPTFSQQSVSYLPIILIHTHWV